MGYPAYLIENELDTTVAISSSSEDSVFTHECLFDEILAKPFRWTEDISGGGSVYVEIDFGAVIEADTIFIGAHNWSTSAVITVKAGASANPSTTIATPTYREFDIYDTFTDPGARFYRVTLTDTLAEVPEIGELLIGKRTTLTSRMHYGFRRGIQHTKITHETIRGVKYLYDLYDRRAYEALFLSIQNAHVAELETLDGLAGGSRTPVVWIPNLSLDDAFYCRMEEQMVVQSVRFNEWNITLVFTEESRGGFVTL